MAINKKDTVAYVGQAKRLCDRLRLGNHHVLTENHRISFVFVDPCELNWAECYYIGITKPPLNFGKRASKNKGNEE
jgi:excinuclease UvrABC nuclease subunit